MIQSQTSSSTAPTTPLEPLPLEIPVLTTESGRFVLRPFTQNDAPAIYEAMSDPRIAATTTIAHPYPDGAAERWITSQGASAEVGTHITWAIATAEDDRAIGAITIHVTPRHRRGELGYWLATPWWSKGIMSEATQTVVAYGFEALGLHRIQARCLPNNVGSARVMEKAGMTFECILHDYSLHKGDFVDLAMYAIVAGRLNAANTSAPADTANAC